MYTKISNLLTIWLNHFYYIRYDSIISSGRNGSCYTTTTTTHLYCFTSQSVQCFVLILQRMMWTHGLTRLTNIRRSRRAMVLRTMMVVHMTAVVQGNWERTQKQSSAGRGSELGHTLSPCPARESDYVAGLALISASMSRVGGRSWQHLLTQQFTWSELNPDTRHGPSDMQRNHRKPATYWNCCLMLKWF